LKPANGQYATVPSAVADEPLPTEQGLKPSVTADSTGPTAVADEPLPIPTEQGLKHHRPDDRVPRAGAPMSRFQQNKD